MLANPSSPCTYSALLARLVSDKESDNMFFFIFSIEVYITYPTLSFLVSFQTQRDNMDFEFAIPINLTDIQTKQSLTDYCVSEVFPARILPNKLAGESVYPMMM